uniref:Arrestin C-terminal-like domain-containing protein n=1 Tax=Anolis carolinensis TaxID=28377 RepID=H9G7H7_ANOCA
MRADPSRVAFCSWQIMILSMPIVSKCRLRSFGTAPNVPITTGTTCTGFCQSLQFNLGVLRAAEFFLLFFVNATVTWDGNINDPNLFLFHNCDQPNTNSITKKFSYKLVKTGNAVLTATTDLKGYVVGQVIQLRTDIENKSGRDTSTIVASLIQKVAYKSKRWIYDLRTIAEVEGSPVKAWKRAEWKEQILVPALPQSILQGCSLIHIDYYIQVSLKTPEVSVALPIYIGNIPVNRIPLSPTRLAPQLPSPVVPSAPPEDEEASGGYPHPMDNVSIPTKSHSQQQQPFSYAPGLNFPEARLDSEQSSSPNHPTLCLSTGATVPYFAEGTVVPMATASSLILPPEYSTWGYPYEKSSSIPQ